jgi:hypothetical protein
VGFRVPACAHSSLREANIAHSIHTHNTRKERKPELCRRNTQFTNPKRAQTRIVYPQPPIHKSQITHTQRNTQEVVGRSEEFKRGWESGYYQLWMRTGLKTGLNHIRRRHKVRLSQIQEYYSVDLSVSVSLSLVV